MSPPPEQPTQPAPVAVAPDLPKPMSQACSAFFREITKLSRFHLFVRLLAAERDLAAIQVRRIAGGPLSGTEHGKELESILRGPGALGALETAEQMLREMILCRAVDCYQTYLADLLALIFTTRPETLRTAEKVSIEDVLQHSDMKDLIAYLADERVQKLAYKGLRDLAKALAERPGFELYEAEWEVERANRIVQLRNLITHNRGVVNKLFLTRVPGHPAQVGERIALTGEGVYEDIGFLTASVCDIEARAARKFGLPQPVPGIAEEGQLEGLSKVLDLLEGEHPDAATPPPPPGT